MEATIMYVMGTCDHKEQYVLEVTDGGETVMVARFYTEDHDRAPAYDGALEAAHQVAETMVDAERIHCA